MQAASAAHAAPTTRRCTIDDATDFDFAVEARGVRGYRSPRQTSSYRRLKMQARLNRHDDGGGLGARACCRGCCY